MYYKDLLNSLIDSEKNPVNKMYLHEIQMKWDKFLEYTDQKKQDNPGMIDALNIFIKKLNQRKFRYNPQSKRGFKDQSDLHKSNYLYDMISVIMKRNEIIKQKGIIWDFAPFTINIGFSPNNVSTIGKKPNFNQSLSEKYLLLGQQLDVQLRAAGKRNFHKYKLTLPLIVFYTAKILTEEFFSECEFSAMRAQNTLNKSKNIIVAESLENGFIPDIKSSSIDAIFVLSKSYFKEGKTKLNAEVLDSIEDYINSILKTKKSSENFKEDGIIM